MGMIYNPRKYTIYLLNQDSVNTNWIISQFDFDICDLSSGLKYLGFFIKPNDYIKKD